MRAQGSTKFKKPFRLVTKTALPLLLILASCSTVQTPPPSSTGQGQTKSTPLACSDFAPMGFNNGQVGVTAADLVAIMKAHPENPIGWARGLVGDTLATRGAISNYAAARKKIGCQ